MGIENKSLWETGYFRVAFWGPVGGAFLTAVPLWFSTQGKAGLCFNAECYHYFLEAFQLPIGILAISIPLCALAASTHRSAQTAHQIELQADQSVFANYYKHLEEFEKHAYERYKNEKSISAFAAQTNVRNLYRLMYPRMQEGDGSLSDKYLEMCKKLADDIRELTNNFRHKPVNDAETHPKRFAESLKGEHKPELQTLDSILTTVGTWSGKDVPNNSENLMKLLRVCTSQIDTLRRITLFDTSESAATAAKCLDLANERMKEVQVVLKVPSSLAYADLRRAAGLEVLE